MRNGETPGITARGFLRLDIIGYLFFAAAIISLIREGVQRLLEQDLPSDNS